LRQWRLVKTIKEKLTEGKELLTEGLKEEMEYKEAKKCIVVDILQYLIV